VSIGLILERFVEICVEQDVPADASLSGSRVLWAVGDAFTTRVITAYHAFDLDSALQDAQRRTDFVRGLLRGQRGGTEPAADLAAYRLDPEGSYAAVRCRVAPGTAEQVRRALERSGSRPDRGALIAVDSGECVGIVAQRPGDDAKLVVGIGPFGPLADIATSFRIASQAHDVAGQLHRSGVFGLEDLTWRLAAASSPDVTRFLRRRYLEPLHAQGEFGALLEETLRAYLAHGLSIPRTAEALVVHANTLRYRLRRFTDLTSCSLESTQVLVELSWVLELGDLVPARSDQPGSL
jgi:putative transposase